jgi:hypothetical protein
MGPPRIRGTRPHLKAVLHNPQRQPGELVRTAAPPDIPSGLACCGQGLGHQGRLSDARLALDPDNRSLATAEGLHGSTQNYKLIFATYPSGGRFCHMPEIIPFTRDGRLCEARFAICSSWMKPAALVACNRRREGSEIPP